jgi:hypothetical protein
MLGTMSLTARGQVIDSSGYYNSAEYYRIDLKRKYLSAKTSDRIIVASNINKGHVIAYGHYIKPPYTIELTDTIVAINNIIVYPGMLHQHDYYESKKLISSVVMSKKDKENYEDLSLVIDYFNSLVYGPNDSYDPKKVKEKVVKFAKTKGNIKKVKVDNNSITIKTKNNAVFTMSIPDEPIKKISENEEKEKNYNYLKGVAKETADDIVKHLSANYIVLTGFLGETPQSRKNMYLSRMYNVLKQSNDSNEKVMEIKQTFSMPLSLSKLLVYNFAPGEWPF